MPRGRWSLTLFLFLTVRAAAQAAPYPTVPARVSAPMARGEIRLDGRLDDSAWSGADSIDLLRQREPSEGEPGSQRTVVLLLRDEHALYVGIRLYDRDPKAIVATQYRRDAELDVDDNVQIVIDSYDDQRTAFTFATNPNGMMWDAQYSGTQDENIDWNGIWDVATTRDSLGWTAEFRIPFRALRFHDGRNVVFGFNVRRFIRRTNEIDLWQSWLRTQGIQQLQFEGDLVIAGELRRGFDAEVRPNASVTYSLPQHDSLGTQTAASDVKFRAGADAKFAVTPTMTADLTANADFAEVESDEQVINLTRFPIIFPEKREFFLESLNLFTFGADLRNQLFYSRRIGLTADGTPVPILAGARVYGNAGDWTLGALTTRTGSPDDAVDAVVRVKRNIFALSYIGAIATVRTGPGVDGAQSAAGFDIDLPLRVHGENIEPKFWIAGTNTPGVPGTPLSWRAYVDYPNDIWDNFISLYRVQSGYDPALGYVLRSGIHETNAHFNWMPRPASGSIRNFDFQLISWDIIAGDSGSLTRTSDWQFAEFDVRPFGLQFQSGDHVAFDIIRDLDAPSDTFFVFPGSAIPPGSYWWTRGLLTATFAPGRVVSGSVSLGAGGFYDGSATTVTASGVWRGGGQFQLGVDAAVSDVRLTGGNFTAVQTAMRLEYDIGTRWSILGFIQHTNLEQRADFQLRVHWIPVVGDDLYIVWNSGYTTYRLAPWRFPAWDALSHQLNGALAIKVIHRIPL
jgi:hypothetical protein